MMDMTPLQSTFKHEFARRATWREDDKRRFLDRERRERKDKDDKEKEADRQMDAFVEAASVILASDTQIASFTVKLDQYDAATIEALLENERQLNLVQAQIDQMLEQAYVLPDGRRVFKTEDGMRVFDEHGEELEQFDPQEIEDWRPRHEQFLEMNQSRDALALERDELIEYQKLSDEMRERIDSDEPLSQDELSELEAQLEEKMPLAVQRVLGRDEPEQTVAQEQQPDFDFEDLRPQLIRDAPGLSGG